MARIEEDREDLFAELVSYQFRWEFRDQETGETLVAGIRPSQRWVVYRGSGNYYQFLPTGELRRAFAGRTTYLSTGTSLASMTKERDEANTTLLRRDLTKQDLDQFLATMATFLAEFHARLLQGAYAVSKQSPPTANPHQELAPLVRIALTSENRLSPGIAR